MISEYIEALLLELSYRRDIEPTIKTLYIGGGTPSILDKTQIQRLLDSIRNNYRLDERCEITIEANPFTIDYDKSQFLYQVGINRLSLGIQSLNNWELKKLGRAQDPYHAIAAVSNAKRAGFSNISVDLLYGIPGQKNSQWTETLHRTIDLEVQHISIYELTLTRGTELYNLVNKGLLTMPEEELIEEMYFNALEILNEAGFVQYEISNFALSGFQCLHNLNYWLRGRYMGFGAGAHSFEGEHRMSIVTDVSKYIDSLRNNNIPMDSIWHLTEQDTLREKLFLGLRMAGGIDKDIIINRSSVIEELLSLGLIEFEQNKIKLTRKGMLLANEVILRLWQ